MPGSTTLLLLKLEAAGNDTLNGGSGEDVLIGQRGNDMLSGDADNDTLFGDGAQNLSPVLTDLPHFLNGLRLLDMEGARNQSLSAKSFGWSFMTPATLYPEVLGFNSPYDINFPYGNVLPDVTDELLRQVGADALQQADGTSLRPFLAMVPEVVRHVGVLPAHDIIDGGAGDDLLIGDNGTVYSPLKTGLDEIDAAATDAQDALDMVMHTLSTLAIDFDHVEHDLRQVEDVHDVHIGEDDIVGGEGADIIAGDDGLIVASFVSGLPAVQSRFVDAALETHQYLRDLQHAAVDLENVLFEAHFAVLNELIDGVVAIGPDHDHHDLFVGNDTIDGSQGDDLVAGDQATILTPVVSGLRFDQVQLGSPIDAATWEAAREALATQQAASQNLLTTHVQQDHDRQSRTIDAAHTQRDCRGLPVRIDHRRRRHQWKRRGRCPVG